MKEHGMQIELSQGEVSIQMLRRGLPEYLFQQIVLILLSGYSAAFATNWLLLQPDCGRLMGFRYETLLPSVATLRSRLRGWLSYPVMELAPEWLRETLERLRAEPTAGRNLSNNVEA